jgi:hypothetical protein
MTTHDEMDGARIQDAAELEEALMLALEGYCDAHEIDTPEIVTFTDAGILTMNRGIVVRVRGGREFQVTIVDAGPWR